MELNSTFQYFQELFLPLSDKIMTAFVLILVGLIVGRFGAKLTQRLLHHWHLNETAKAAYNIKVSVEELAALFIRYFIYLVFIILALNTLGLTVFIVELLAFAFMIVLLISGFLSLKDFVPNFLAGLKLQRDDFMKETDTIKFNSIEGRVQSINLTDTVIRTKKGDLMAIPNSHLQRQKITRLKRK